MAHLSIRSASKVFKDTVVLKSIDLEVEDGEFVVLVGPSGCGKSTLLRVISGLEELTSGEIAIDGRRVNEVAPSDRDIAMVFQSYALYPHMTVRKNLSFSLRIRRMSKQEMDDRIEKAARILGIDRLLDRLPKQLSGGQRQRVAMGRAIVRDPQLFLFDEPLSNLDASLRVQMRKEIKELHQRLRSTSIYVTHDQIEAMTLADRIVVLRDGNVEQVGTPSELYSQPENLFVAGFIGSPAMNFLKGRTVSAADGYRIAFADTSFPLPHHIEPPSGDVIVGIRPDAVAVTPEGDQPARVVLVEPTGRETVLECSVGEQKLEALIGGVVSLEPGADIRLGFDFGQAHIFDAETGRRLRPQARRHELATRPA